MVEPSFRHAARRHLEDALRLERDNSFANADHLSGFAAECAIKGLVVDHLGGRVVNGFPYTRDNEKLRAHAGTVLWDTVSQLASGHPEPEVVGLFSEPNPFTDWDVSDRYAEGSHVSSEALGRHLAGARRAIFALEAASLSMNDGI